MFLYSLNYLIIKMQKTHETGFLISLLLLTSLTFVSAGPTNNEDLTLLFDIPSNLDGEWKLYFISVGEFEKEGWNFTGYFETIKKEYAKSKGSCGGYGAFYSEVYEMGDEERKHKGCEINGTYQEVYCFRTAAKDKKCSHLAEYKLNEEMVLDFGSFYDSYMWDIKRAGFYEHYSVSSCRIENSTCKMKLDKKSSPYNPYIIVLEELDSKTEVHFSGKVEIKAAEMFYDEKFFPCKNDICENHASAKIKVSEFKVLEPNFLKIKFNDETEILSNNNENPMKKVSIWEKLIGFFKNLFS